MRYLIKGGWRFELLALPLPEDKIQSCPMCDVKFDRGNHRRTTYLTCGHINCLACVGASIGGCDQCKPAARNLIEKALANAAARKKGSQSSNPSPQIPSAPLSVIVPLPPPPPLPPHPSSPPPPKQSSPFPPRPPGGKGRPAVLALLKKKRKTITALDEGTQTSNDYDNPSTNGIVERDIKVLPQPDASETNVNEGGVASPPLPLLLTLKLEAQSSRPPPPSSPAVPRPLVFRCIHCEDVSFADRNSLGAHYNEEHKALRPYLCNICQWRFIYKRQLVIHKRTHTDLTPYKCHICSMGFLQHLDFKLHMESLHGLKQTPGSEERKLERSSSPPRKRRRQQSPPKENGDPVPHCSSSKGPSTFKKGKPSPSKKRYSCPHCEKSFETEMNRFLHFRMAHRTIYPHWCKQCVKCFTIENGLQIHVRTHQQGRTFKCTKCGKNYGQRYRLDQHQRIMHAPKKETSRKRVVVEAVKTQIKKEVNINIKKKKKEKKIPRRRVSELVIIKPARQSGAGPGRQRLPKCPYCEKTYPKLQHLISHCRMAHPDTKPFLCDICRLPFAGRIELRRHQMTHSTADDKDTIYNMKKCDLCDSTFNYNCHKEKHMLSFHRIRMKLSDEDKAKNLEHCPECQTKFDDGKDGVHRKVAYSLCGHLLCMDCVVRGLGLGCGQCTTEENSKPSKKRTGRTSESPLPSSRPILERGSKSRSRSSSSTRTPMRLPNPQGRSPVRPATPMRPTTPMRAATPRGRSPVRPATPMRPMTPMRSATRATTPQVKSPRPMRSTKSQVKVRNVEQQTEEIMENSPVKMEVESDQEDEEENEEPPAARTRRRGSVAVKVEVAPVEPAEQPVIKRGRGRPRIHPIRQDVDSIVGGAGGGGSAITKENQDVTRGNNGRIPARIRTRSCDSRGTSAGETTVRRVTATVPAPMETAATVSAPRETAATVPAPNEGAGTDMRWTCQHCFLQFHLKSLLHFHLKDKHGDIHRDSNGPCDVCNSRRNLNLNLHLLKRKMMARTYGCNFCNRRFLRKALMVQHVAKAHKKVQRKSLRS